MSEVQMSEEQEKTHKNFGATLFNNSWGILDKADRSEDDIRTLINMAHASAYHWQQVGKPENLQRSEWMLANVYAELKRSEPAMYHAKRCRELTEKHDMKDWDLAYSYEVLARAQKMIGNFKEYDKNKKLAREAGETIENADIKKQFDADMETWHSTAELH